jgi:hypothetical protein
LDGLPQLSNCYCLPGKAGGSPGGLDVTTVPGAELSCANVTCAVITRKDIEIRRFSMTQPCQLQCYVGLSHEVGLEVTSMAGSQKIVPSRKV